MKMVRKSTPDRGSCALETRNSLLILGTVHSGNKFSGNGGLDASDGSRSGKWKSRCRIRDDNEYEELVLNIGRGSDGKGLG